MDESGGTRMHSRFNRLMAIVMWILALFILIGAAVSRDANFIWGYPLAGLIAFLAWAALWRPYVGIGDPGVRLQNVTHRVDVPWGALIHTDTRFALTLFTPNQRFVAWSAPAPGALSSALRAGGKTPRESRAAGAQLRPGDLLGTDSGDAVTVLREQWQARVESGSIEQGVADELSVTRRWDIPVIALSVILLVTTVYTLVTTT